MSKGLLKLARELNVSIPAKCSLAELKSKLSQHPAFRSVRWLLSCVLNIETNWIIDLVHKLQVTKLEKLAAVYEVKVLFTPKFHCETNPIEGYWCYSKTFIRKNTDQSFQSLNRLIPESKTIFIEKEIHLKLFRRFWNTINAYSDGKGYSVMLIPFYSGLCQDNIISQRKITNTNIDGRRNKWTTITLRTFCHGSWLFCSNRDSNKRK